MQKRYTNTTHERNITKGIPSPISLSAACLMANHWVMNTATKMDSESITTKDIVGGGGASSSPIPRDDVEVLPLLFLVLLGSLVCEAGFLSRVLAPKCFPFLVLKL